MEQENKSREGARQQSREAVEELTRGSTRMEQQSKGFIKEPKPLSNGQPFLSYSTFLVENCPYSLIHLPI